jgi:hypothetical protein
MIFLSAADSAQSRGRLRLRVEHTARRALEFERSNPWTEGGQKSIAQG